MNDSSFQVVLRFRVAESRCGTSKRAERTRARNSPPKGPHEFQPTRREESRGTIGRVGTAETGQGGHHHRSRVGRRRVAILENGQNDQNPERRLAATRTRATVSHRETLQGPRGQSPAIQRGFGAGELLFRVHTYIYPLGGSEWETTWMITPPLLPVLKKVFFPFAVA